MSGLFDSIYFLHLPLLFCVPVGHSFFTVTQYYYVWVSHNLFTPGADKHLGAFPCFCCYEYQADMSICLQVFLWSFVCIFIKHVPRSRISGSQGCLIFYQKLQNSFLKRLYLFVLPPVIKIESSTKCMRVSYTVFLLGIWFSFSPVNCKNCVSLIQHLKLNGLSINIVK